MDAKREREMSYDAVKISRAMVQRSHAVEDCSRSWRQELVNLNLNSNSTGLFHMVSTSLAKPVKGHHETFAGAGLFTIQDAQLSV